MALDDNNLPSSMLIHIHMFSGASRALTDDLKLKLTSANKYMKTDFRLNLEVTSSCINHCITYALSDGTLCDHEHELSCQRCMGVESVLDRIEKLVQSDTLKYR